jgi:hypothetical protein
MRKNFLQRLRGLISIPGKEIYLLFSRTFPKTIERPWFLKWPNELELGSDGIKGELA